MRIELFEGVDGWRWRLRADNGEILATSEAYSDKSAAVETVQSLHRLAQAGELVVDLG